MRKTTRLAILAAALLMLQGCALDRSVLSPDVGAMPENPEQGVAVRFERVDDTRIFEAAPPTPDTASLGGGDIQKPELKARAIARKRNGFGAALGDVMLPEGQTVSALVTDTLTQAFRRAGYRVLTSQDAGYAQAVPIRARINEFWTWFNPGAFAITLTNRIDVSLEGTLPVLKEGPRFRNEASEQAMAATDGNWQKVISKGLAEFSEKLRLAMASKP